MKQPITYEFLGPLANDEPAQRAIEERFERAFAERRAQVTPDSSEELAFVDAWRDVRAAFPEWADWWGASRA